MTNLHLFYTTICPKNKSRNNSVASSIDVL